MEDELPPVVAIVGGLLLIGAAIAASTVGRELVATGVRRALDGY